LRCIETAQEKVQPEASKEAQHEGLGAARFLLPVVAIGVGGLTVAIAATYKKGWRWWIVGALMLALGVYFYWSDQNAEKRS
jgi:hypothetical protein